VAFLLTILGSSSALPTSERHPAAHVLNIHERFFLIDCGEGTQMQLRKYRIRLGKLHHIFISHVHGDHVFGLYGLLSSLSLLGREYPLHVYAPAHFEAHLRQHLADFDIYLGYELVFHPLHHSRSEKIYEDDRITVETLPLKHRVPTLGFLFREKPRPRNIYPDMIKKYNMSLKQIRQVKNGSDLELDNGTRVLFDELTYSKHVPVSYAYCSDTVYTESFLEKIRNIDVLYHEATYDGTMKKRAVETGHSTSLQAATLARKAGVGKLIMGHFSARYKQIEPLVEEARTIFPHTVAAVDGETYEILPGGSTAAEER